MDRGWTLYFFISSMYKKINNFLKFSKKTRAVKLVATGSISLHLCPSLTPHLPNCRVLLPQAHNNDAVCLTNAPLSPRGQCVVCLVKNNAMDVFLLAQPAGKTILMDTEKDKFNEKLMTLLNWKHKVDPFSCCAEKAYLNRIYWASQKGTATRNHTINHTCLVLQLQAAVWWYHWSEEVWDLHVKDRSADNQHLVKALGHSKYFYFSYLFIVNPIRSIGVKPLIM